MSSSSGSNLYSQGFGSTSSNSFPGNAIRATRPPSSTDVRGPQGNYIVGQLWVDMNTESSYQLANISSSQGTVSAAWIVLGGGSSSLAQLSADTGIAFPVGGNIDIVGGSGVSTSASGDTLTISLTGGGEAIDSVTMQAGTSPITPDGTGTISLSGAVVAAGSVPIQSNGTGASAATIQVQTSQAIAAADATKIGLSNFNNADFTVDSTGFVSSIGGGFTRVVGVDTSTAPGSDPVVPTAGGLITVTGGQVAAGVVGTNVIRTDSLAANTYTIEIQRSQAVVSSAVINNGVCHFNNDNFTVDGNGFVSLTGGGAAVDSFVPNSGTSPVLPAGDGSITMQGTGSLTVVGGTNSLTPQLTGLTNHNVLVGAGTATITNVPPSATTGIPLVSGGASADPSFSTAVVAGGGTGLTTATAYSPICGGTTGTGNFQSASSGQFTSGFVLTSTGTSSLPTWQNASDTDAVKTIQGDTGTVTPTAGAVSIIGGPGIATTGSGDTLTVAFTGTAGVVASGTFTPTISFGGASVGTTYLTQAGSYVVVGTPGSGNAMVSACCRFTLLTKGSSTGNASIEGLPFAANTGTSSPLGVMSCVEDVAVSAGYNVILGRVDSTATFAILIAQPISPNDEFSFVTDSNFADTSSVSFTITYQC